MGRQTCYTVINTLDFAVYGINYVTLKDMQYDGIKVPKGYVFDGVTAKAPFTFLWQMQQAMPLMFKSTTLTKTISL